MNEMPLFQIQQQNNSKNFVEYVIRKGNHYSEGNNYRIMDQAEIRFQVIFDSSAIYKTRRVDNQYDINKLYGFSDCGSVHHQNSARFGWRWNGNSIELHAYWYSDSIRYNSFLDTISIERTTELAIKILPGNYLFEVKNKKYLFPRTCNSINIEGYRLYPYFGGDEMAPHDIKIRIKEL
jgi:hypothetical protein